MRALLPAALAISIVSAAICQAEQPDFRNQATAIVERIQMKAPPISLYEEFGNIVETFAQAEELFAGDKIDEAESLYHLAVLKSTLYEEKVGAMEKEEPGDVRPAQAASDTPDNTDGDAGADPPLAPPLSPPVADRAGEREAAPEKPAASAPIETDNSPPHSVMIIGKSKVYTVRKGDTLRKVGARFGVNWRTIARDNGLDPKNGLKPGRKLQINTSRIIPKTIKEGIVINIPERTLYLFKGQKLEKTLPVGLGKRKSRDAAIWQTPTGKFRIVSKVKDPTWFVPVSIQTEMKQQGKPVKTIVPPGDRNPLGKYALKTSISGILIHGTIFPESIYGFNSHGCIRVLPRNMEEIYNETRVNMDGEIIYQPVKMAVADDGRVFLEVHGDIYDRYKSLEEVAKGLIIKNNAERMVDWEKVRSLVKEKSGIPEDVTVQPDPLPLRTSMNKI